MATLNFHTFIYTSVPGTNLVLGRVFHGGKNISSRIGRVSYVGNDVISSQRLRDRSGRPARRSTRDRLYFAAPLDVGSAASVYQAALAAARRCWPDYEIFEPLTKNWNTEQWLELWPIVLASLSVLTVIPRSDGSIGKGCYKEIVEARWKGIPVFVYLDNTGEFEPFEKIRRVSSKHRSLIYYAFIYPHSKPGYYEYSSDELERVWIAERFAPAKEKVNG